MRGTILDFDHRSGCGIISGMDDRRYPFTTAEVAGNPRQLYPGTPVDFTIEHNQAIGIYALSAQVATPSRAAAPPVAQKSKIAAGLFALFLGGIGVHKFYLGQTSAGVIMLLCSLFGAILLFIPTFIIGIIALVEGIIYLTKTDEAFYETYEANKRAWF